MKFAFMPIGIVAGLLAGQVSRKLFDAIWGLFDEEEAPHPKHREIDWVKLIPALIIEGAVFRIVRGLVDHSTRRGFAKVTGTWPGEERPEPA
jgi:Protein of unknown function (DUF4235)